MTDYIVTALAIIGVLVAAALGSAVLALAAIVPGLALAGAYGATVYVVFKYL